MHFGLMLRETKVLGAKLLYLTTSQVAINCPLDVARKHSPCDLHGVADGRSWRSHMYTASCTFLFGFLSCENNQMLIALCSCTRSLSQKQ
jgi:hypothetical protein